MYAKIIFFLFSFLFLQHSHAQKSHLDIRFAPLSLIDFYNGSCYKGGLEFQFGGNYGVFVDAGGYFRNFNVFRNYSGHVFETGVKRYFQRFDEGASSYLGINFTYKNQAFDFSDSLFGGGALDYRTHKFVSCINFIFGNTMHVNERWIFDVYGGLGVRVKHVNSSATKSEIADGIQYGDSMSLYFLVTPGHFIYPNLHVGFRIGFRLF